jgi:long-chain fatty acid transport protein
MAGRRTVYHCDYSLKVLGLARVAGRIRLTNLGNALKKKVLAVLVPCTLCYITVNDANAAAFALSEQGASGLGNAYAGVAAVAEDASTVWWNPAGMSRLPPGKHLLFAGHLLIPSTKFSNGGSTVAPASNPARTGNGGDAGDPAFVPNVFFAMDLNPSWNFGLGINVPFGLKTEYDSDWIGRFQGIRSEVKTLNINPAVSYKFSDRASVGVGVSYQRGEIDLLSAVNYSGIAFGAGGAALLGAVGGAGVEGQNSTSVDGDAWGFNIGALFNVSPATRLGVHYRSSVNYKMDGNTSFGNVPAAFAGVPALAAATSSGDVKLELETPATLSFSAAHNASDRLELLGDITWTQWSEIKNLPLVRTSGPASGSTLDTLTFNFKDTVRIALGANYKWSGPWTLKAGVAFDQSPVPNAADRSVRLPDNDRYWLSLGASYRVSPVSRFDFGYTFISIKDADINNDQTARARGIVRGTYEAHVNILSLQYQHSF